MRECEVVSPKLPPSSSLPSHSQKKSLQCGVRLSPALCTHAVSSVYKKRSHYVFLWFDFFRSVYCEHLSMSGHTRLPRPPGGVSLGAGKVYLPIPYTGHLVVSNVWLVIRALPEPLSPYPEPASGVTEASTWNPGVLC